MLLAILVSHLHVRARLWKWFSTITICGATFSIAPLKNFAPPVMARGQRDRTSTANKADPVGSDEDTQALRRSGKASFNRDEQFQDSEDECIAFPIRTV